MLPEIHGLPKPMSSQYDDRCSDWSILNHGSEVTGETVSRSAPRSQKQQNLSREATEEMKCTGKSVLSRQQHKQKLRGMNQCAPSWESFSSPIVKE